MFAWRPGIPSTGPTYQALRLTRHHGRTGAGASTYSDPSRRRVHRCHLNHVKQSTLIGQVAAPIIPFSRNNAHVADPTRRMHFCMRLSGADRPFCPRPALH